MLDQIESYAAGRRTLLFPDAFAPGPSMQNETQSMPGLGAPAPAPVATEPPIIMTPVPTPQPTLTPALTPAPTPAQTPAPTLTSATTAAPQQASVLPKPPPTPTPVPVAAPAGFAGVSGTTDGPLSQCTIFIDENIDLQPDTGDRLFTVTNGGFTLAKYDPSSYLGDIFIQVWPSPPDWMASNHMRFKLCNE